MKITKVETVLLTGPSTGDPYLSQARKRRSAAFIEIYTDGGIMGLGETYAGYFIPEIVPEIVKFFEPILVGQDPDNIQLLWDRMYHCGNFWCRTGVGLHVLTGIEAALWDIKGKAEGVPVYKLLGGTAYQSLPAYATGGPANYPLDTLIKKAEYYLSLGFTAFKVAAGKFEDGKFTTSRVPGEAAALEYEKVKTLRGHFGPDTGIMLDGHMGNWPDHETAWTFETAKAVMAAVEEFNLAFFEEPLHYNDRSGYAELTRGTTVPIAGGECLAGTVEWQPYAEDGCFNIGQPDAAYVGGILQFMAIAKMLDEAGCKIATHSWAAGGGFMQNIHAGFAAPNTAILEIAPNYGPLHSEVIGDSFIFKNGRVYPPETPGLGITLTSDTKARFPFVRGSGEFNSVPGKILVD